MSRKYQEMETWRAVEMTYLSTLMLMMVSLELKVQSSNLVSLSFYPPSCPGPDGADYDLDDEEDPDDEEDLDDELDEDLDYDLDEDKHGQQHVQGRAAGN